MRKLTKLYSALALLTFNSIILALIVVWGLEDAVHLRHVISDRGQVVHSDDIDLSSFQLVW